MSFLTPKPTKDGASSIPTQARRAAATPVFKPEFGRSLRMHPVLAACVALGVCALLLAYAARQRSMFEAESLVYVQPTATRPLAEADSGAFDATGYDSYLQQQIETAGRLDILLAAVHTLPIGTWQMPGESDTSAATRLQNAVKVERVLSSFQLSFTLRGADPVKTAATLNAVVAAYLAAGRRDELTQSGQRAQILDEERQRLGTELARDRTEQAQLAASLGMANPGVDNDNPYDAQLAGLRGELATARENHDIAAAQLGSISGTDGTNVSGLASAADEMIAGDAGLSSMRATISQRRATLTGQMAGLTPENPLYKQDQEELADLDRTQDAMTRDMRDKASRRLENKLRTDLARTGDVEARLNAELARQTSLASGAAPRLQRASELAADMTRLSTRYATVDNSLRGLQLESTAPGLARLSLAATPPLVPLPSRRKLVIAAALPLGLLCGLFAAVFARKRDRRLYVGRDLEEALGFTPIAVLPAAEEVSPHTMSEYLLRLAGGVESAYRMHGARTFVLSAVGPSSGFRGLIAPLGEQLNALGLDAVSVSAPQVLHGSFAADPDSGEFSLSLPEAARTQDRRQESVATSNLERLKSMHGLIFVESPPLLTSAETEYLVRCADATILFAESGVTTRGEMLQAALLLEQLQVKGIGTVLEGLRLRHADPGFKRALAELERRQGEQAAELPVHARLPHKNAPDFAVAEGEAQRVNAALTQDQRADVPSNEFPRPLADLAPGHVQAAELPGVESHQAELRQAELPLVDTLTQQAQPAAEVQALPPCSGVSTATEPVADMLPVSAAVTPPEPFIQLLPEADPMKREAESLLRIVPDPAGEVASLRPASSSRHTSTPAPPARSWFSRLLHGEEEPVPSIVPHEEDDEDLQSEPAAVIHSVPVIRDSDIQPVRQVAASPAAPASFGSFQPAAAPPVLTESVQPAYVEQTIPQAAPEPILPNAASTKEEFSATRVPIDPAALAPAQAGSTLGVPEACDASYRPVRIWEEVAEPETVHAQTPSKPTSAAAPQPAAAAQPVLGVAEDPTLFPAMRPGPAPRPIHFEPLHATVGPVPTVLVAPELPSARSSARMAVLPQPVVLSPETPEPRLVPPQAVEPRLQSQDQFQSAPAQAQAQPPMLSAATAPWRNEPSERPSLFFEPVRTARWDPIPPLRAQVAPWRDRRVPGSDSHIRPSQDRRFRTGSSAAHEAASPASAPAQTPPATAQPSARPQLVQREPRLTRRWGLLSRFAEGEPRGDAGSAEETIEHLEDRFGYNDDHRANGSTRRS